MEILQPKVGDRVRVRQHTWIVHDVDAYEHCRVLTLASAAAQGSVPLRQFIHPFDDVEGIERGGGSRRVSIRSWRHLCRSTLLEDGPSWGLRTAIRARIDLMPYQLEPALALLRGLGSRVLIADDVGLGKTVQAMLAAAELRARGLASRMLIVCPAGLREQWTEECVTRFGMTATIMDQQGIRRARATRSVGVNPWTAESIVIASIDYVKRPEILPSVLEAGWDLVIVDEAHGACGQSDRRDAMSSVCSRAGCVLLLSATPHNGDEVAFSTLCGLGQHADELVVFRRSRAEAGRDSGRRAHTVRVAGTAAESRMHGALAALTRAIVRESADMDRGVWLMLSLLYKRALSSPFALASSAERRLRMLAEGAHGGVEQLLLPLDDETGELDAADAAPMWSVPALRDARHERRLLEEVIAAARQAEGLEGKLQRLRRLLRAIREPVIVFTEYRDTLLHVRNQVAPGAAVVHGGLTREQRRAALSSFPSAGVLLATDAAGEGLNLHEHCRIVINLELPWNPMRLEQRIGRVDRIGQRRRVHAFHLVTEHETRLLDRVSTRVSRAGARADAPNPLAGRPAWTDDLAARVIVFREDDIPEEPSAVWAPPHVPFTRLRQEGEREAARIGSMRLIVGGGNTDPGVAVPGGTLIVARTRRRRMRSVLRGRYLAVFRSTLVDGGGRAVATRVVGASGRTTNRATGVSNLEPRLHQVARELEASSTWHLESVDAHVAMIRRRVDRARAIAESLARSTVPRQPGLFDRRAEHVWQLESESSEAARSSAIEQSIRAELGLALRLSITEPVLVLSTDTKATLG